MRSGTTTPITRFGLSTSRRGVVVVVATLLLCGWISVLSTPGQAQTSDELETIREQRRQAQEEAASQAREIDVATVEVDALTEALAVLQAQVNAAQERLAGAERSLADAEQRVLTAQQAVGDKQIEIEQLRAQMIDRAITSFVNQSDAVSVFVDSEDPNQAIRMHALVQDVTEGEADLGEQLRGAEEDLRIQEALASDAANEAATLRDQVQVELGSLDEARGAQADLTAEAEARLDQQLNEFAAIQQFDGELAAQEQNEIDRLAEELRRKTTPPPPASGGGGGGGQPSAPVGNDEIVSVRGIQVHVSIADQVERMLAAADAAGVSLSGGGYRSSDGQIAVRKNNCGTSDYAIWEMPASQCRPPTARPGTSQHEKGLAIDFTYNGQLIRSRSNDGYRWLDANAASYGFYNLPSEPWHWSTTGR